MNKIILASASPRRRELLEQIGFEFEVMTSDCEEKITSLDPIQIVEELSRQKAENVFEKQEGKKDIIVIGADTIVVFEGKIMGKPKSYEDACDMLLKLQGETHKVYTGVTFCYEKNNQKLHKTFYECTEVSFYSATEEEIRNYVDSEEPMDKAGAYGIQGRGAVFVEKIKGDYNNVVGLPIARLYKEIKTL